LKAVLRTLEVWCFGHLAGRLVDDGEALALNYDQEWLTAGYPPLSQSLPLSGEFAERNVKAFFGGLLPEGELRQMLALELGVSEENDFSILEHVGGDCAGAVSLYVPGKAPRTSDGRVDWLTDAGLSTLVGELPERPMYAGPDDEYRLSLAGAQDKLPVVVGEKNGRQVGIPREGRPSTHILKTPIARLPATVLNEAFCLRLGAQLGVISANAEPRKVNGSEVLLVERYDRAMRNGKTIRLHQEDFCQALSIESSRKYESEGGPKLVDCVELLRGVSRTPASDLPRFLEAWALSYLVGNHDAHGKNYSLLYDESGPALAPAYDVLSTIAYRRFKRMDHKMAMKVGGQRYPDRMSKSQLDRFLVDAGYGPAPSRRRLRALAEKAPGASREVAQEFKDRYWWDPILDDIVAIVGERAARLKECARPD
jgi:serine/threonine-protein kinase HipA